MNRDVLLERFEEAKRWFQQALRDLEASVSSMRNGYYEWSCFQAQQACEKAVKSLLYATGKSAWGHSIIELLEYLRGDIEVEAEIYTHARELDRHYIPSRYPNAFESGYPALYYDEEVANRAINSCREIIKWVKKQLERIGLKM